jgi:hypothetical protein
MNESIRAGCLASIVFLTTSREDRIGRSLIIELNSVKEAMFNVDSPSLLLLEVLSPLIVI